MIQITKWLNIDEEVWHANKCMSIMEWLELEKKRLSTITQKKCVIKTDKGKLALFRERIK